MMNHGNASSLRIHLAGPGDAPLLETLSRQAGATGEAVDWRDMVEGGAATALVAQRGKALLAAAYVRDEPICDMGLVLGIDGESAVDIGQAVVRACIARAMRQGAAVVIAKVCPPSEQVEAVYRGVGFRLVQVLPYHRQLRTGEWADAHVFALAVPEPHGDAA